MRADEAGTARDQDAFARESHVSSLAPSRDYPRRVPGFPAEQEVLTRLVAWGESEPAIRAMVLTSTRARPDGTVDVLSDYDVIVLVDDVGAFLESEAWLQAWPEPLARWGDESELLGRRTVFRGVVHADGTKIDWTIWPAGLADAIAAEDTLPDQLDVGYRVLLDRDGRTGGWPPPRHRAHIPSPPSAAVPRPRRGVLVERHLRGQGALARRGRVREVRPRHGRQARRAPAVARMARRDRPRLGLEAGSLRPGHRAGSARRLRTELQATYVGSGVEENWEALLRTTALFQRVAHEVSDALGFEYPQDVDDGVSAHLERVRALPPRP